MSTEREAVLVVGVDSKQAYDLGGTELLFDNWICKVQEETRWLWFEDEGLFGDPDLMPDDLTVGDLMDGVGSTLTSVILEEVQHFKEYFGEVPVNVRPCVFSY